MKNDTSLIPSNIKNIINEYKNSFSIIFKNKWLYLAVLFLVFTQILTKISIQLYKRIFFSDLYSQKIIIENTMKMAQMSFSEKINYAFSSIQLYDASSSLSFLGIFSLLGVSIAFFIFYKKCSVLFKLSFIKKISLYLIILLILGLTLGFISFLLKSLIFIYISTLICLFALVILFLILFTEIESIFLSFLKLTLLDEIVSMEKIADNSKIFFRSLFLFNIILSLITSASFTIALSLPDLLNYYIFGEFSNFGNLIPRNISFGISWILTYGNALFIILFIFIPFILAINPSENLLGAFRKNIKIIKSNFKNYIVLVLSGIFSMYFLSFISEIITPSDRVYLPLILVKEIVRSSLMTLFLILFSIMIFKYIINYDKKA